MKKLGKPPEFYVVCSEEVIVFVKKHYQKFSYDRFRTRYISMKIQSTPSRHLPAQS